MSYINIFWLKHFNKKFFFLFLRGSGNEISCRRTLKELEIQIGEKVIEIFKKKQISPHPSSDVVVGRGR